YLRYTTPTYNTVATVIIKDEKNGGAPAELSAFADMGMFSGMGTNSIENELGIFRSKRLMTNVARELELNIRYFEEGTVRTTELFAEKPFNIQVLKFDEERFMDLAADEEATAPLFFTIQSDSTYTVANEEAGWEKKMNFGEALELPYAEISVTPNFAEAGITVEELKETIIKVAFNTIENAASAYRERVQVNLTDKNASLIELSLQDA